MEVSLTDFSNADSQIICEIIYKKLCDLGLDPEGFCYAINVEVKIEEDE